MGLLKFSVNPRRATPFYISLSFSCEAEKPGELSINNCDARAPDAPLRSPDQESNENFAPPPRCGIMSNGTRIVDLMYTRGRVRRRASLLFIAST